MAPLNKKEHRRTQDKVGQESEVIDANPLREMESYLEKSERFLVGLDELEHHHFLGRKRVC